MFKVRAGELGLGVPVHRRSTSQRSTSFQRNLERCRDKQGASSSFSQIYKTSSLFPGPTFLNHMALDNIGLLGCFVLGQEQHTLKLSVCLLSLRARLPVQISS